MFLKIQGRKAAPPPWRRGTRLCPPGRPSCARAAHKRAARASSLDQALCSHFSKMASHCCVAHLTDSSAVIAPVAAFAIMSQMMKLL